MSTKLKSKILKLVRNKKLNVFGLFFLLTFVFLAMTKLAKKYTDDITLDITYVNLPKETMITFDSLPKCHVTVSDYGFNLLLNRFKEHSVKVDFNKDVYIKDSTYVWVISKFKQNISSQLGFSAEVVSLEEDTIWFPFETLSSRRVPVVLNSKILFKPGYDILNPIKILPDSIDVIGSPKEISEISKVETELLNLKDVTDTINKVLVLMKSDSPNVNYSINKVNVSAKVEKFTEGTLEVPVSIVNKPLEVNINYFPKTIAVSYYVSLNNYKNIKPLDFKVECDFSEIQNSGKAFFVPKLVKFPDLVKNVRLKQNKVEFILMQ